jgi:deazaflavin-dependent oxidoreductase (nitroreductase family)
MTAAAAATLAGRGLTGDVRSAATVLAAVSLAVAGGLVEGTAVGLAQHAALRPDAPRLPRRRFVEITVLVAGLGWAAVSLPGILAGDDGAEPSPLLVTLGSLPLGAALGGLLGAAQSIALRGVVAHPARWTGVSAAAWTPTMAVMFAGASTAGASWPVAAVLPWATGTGLAAGAVLGLVSAWLVPSLQGSRLRDRLVLRMLAAGRGRRLRAAVTGLRVQGRRTGAWHELPVEYAEVPDGLVVVPGHPDRKQWWRNLRQESPVAVLRDGLWLDASARVLAAGDPAYGQSRQAYLRRFPRARLPRDAPLVRITLGRQP